VAQARRVACAKAATPRRSIVTRGPPIILHSRYSRLLCCRAGTAHCARHSHVYQLCGPCGSGHTSWLAACDEATSQEAHAICMRTNEPDTPQRVPNGYARITDTMRTTRRKSTGCPCPNEPPTARITLPGVSLPPSPSEWKHNPLETPHTGVAAAVTAPLTDAPRHARPNAAAALRGLLLPLQLLALLDLG